MIYIQSGSRLAQQYLCPRRTAREGLGTPSRGTQLSSMNHAKSCCRQLERAPEIRSRRFACCTTCMQPLDSWPLTVHATSLLCLDQYQLSGPSPHVARADCQTVAPCAVVQNESASRRGWSCASPRSQQARTFVLCWRPFSRAK